MQLSTASLLQGLPSGGNWWRTGSVGSLCEA